jgi:hypothetical protein
MAEFKDSIPHTGGIITIRKRDTQHSLGYRHVGMHAASVEQLLAVDGRAAAVIPFGGLSLRDEPISQRQLYVALNAWLQGQPAQFEFAPERVTHGGIKDWKESLIISVRMRA